ncbi:MAG: Ca-activated chloride channel family protein [Saprospiraceae bacterium]|jgi:Ca-activated chloride channel family protein
MKRIVYFSLLFISTMLLFSSCSRNEDLRLENRDLSFEDSNGSPTLEAGTDTDPNGEGYEEYDENDFILTSEEAISTFSIDADGASYANVRRFLNSGNLPPQGAIRTEELLNYFEMDYDYPTGNDLLKMNAEVATCPWKSANYLMRIGVRGKDIPTAQLPNSNFVFLIDVSGSMNSPAKIELLKTSFIEFVEFLPPNDRIAIVTYSGSSNVILNSTPVSQSQTIISAIQSLETGGGTNGAEGIITAYEIAEANFIEGGNNRLIVGTDGDFNIGVSSNDALVELIEEKRETGVFLSVLGFGTGNLQDGKMESISNNGNGTYEYIDATPQATKVFIDEYKKFYAAAKDVKMQITFNSNTVSAYRLSR